MSARAQVEAERHGALVLARLTGEVDRSNTGAVREELERGVPNDAVALVLDLDPVRYLDSSGVHMLLRLSEALRTRGQELRLVVGPSARVRRVVEITELDRLLPVHASAAAASGES